MQLCFVGEGGGGWEIITLVSIWCDHYLPGTSSHGVDQIVDCGLLIVGSLLFNACAKLLDIDRNWNMPSYTLI